MIAGGLSWLEVTQPYMTSNSYADFLPSQPPALSLLAARAVKSSERYRSSNIDRVN